MTDKLRLIAAVIIGVIACTGVLWASNAVTIVPNLDGTTAGFSVSHNNSGDQVSLSVPAISLNSVTMNGTEYKQVSLPVADHLFPAEMADDGSPDVPILTTMLAIPDQVGIQLNVTYSGYDTFEDIDLAPMQPSPSDAIENDVVPFTLNQDVYNTDAFYPGELAVADEPVIMRDVRGVQIEINPVQYNPVRRELRVYRDLAVSVTYGGEPVNPKTTRTPYLSEGFYPLYQSMFSNFDQMFAGAEVKRGGYLIICKASLVDSLKALAMWKHQKGYTTRIVPTTEINSNGSPTAAQVLTYLTTAYHTWEVPPEYLMLVGDMDGTLVVPDYQYQSYPSDQRYSQLDGTDFLPDIFVARLSVDNVSQLRVAVSKIFKYEKMPLMRDAAHWTRGFSCGFTMYNTARLTTLWVRQLSMRHGFTQVDTVYGSSHDARVVQVMNSGPGMIWYRGEGGDQGWWGVDYSVSDLNAMPNHQKLGIMTPMTCGLGDFSANECFGETWIRMGLNVDSLKGGPAFFGVSDHFTHTKWNNPIMIGYFFGIFESNIYHFAAAAVAGKLQDYRTFPRVRQTYVQQYFNTYNMQGDPELEMRTSIPILLNVTRPDTLAFGLNHIEVSVVDTAGHPINQAYVTLIKMNGTTEETYSVGKTDEAGNVEMSFDALTPGSMTLTVSGQNLYPYQGQVQLVYSHLAVGYADSLAIDDDMSGFSYGNGDSLADPGETLELYVALKNFGDSVAANNLVTSLTSLSEGQIEILDGSRNYGNLAPGEVRVDQQPYVIHISPDVQDGDVLRLKQSVTDENNDSWYSVIDIPVRAPKFMISNVAIQDNNNRLDPGDTVNMVVTIVNQGHVNATGVTASIKSEDDFISILDNHTTFGDMPIADTSSNVSDSLVFALDRGAFAGRRIDFTLNTITSLGAKMAVPFSVTADSVVVTTDPTGPDNYGYYMYDKTDTGFTLHPTYDWVELAPGLGGQGTRLTFSNNDDKSVLVNLPSFDFVYYGSHYRSLIVCTNGFISPDTFRYDAGNYWADFFNWPIPDPGNCRAQISPFWDDLMVSTSGNYGVFTWNDTTAHRFVIEWNHVTLRSTGAAQTFEIIIYDPAFRPSVTGDADMLFQYTTFTNNDTINGCTVGFESWDQLTGVSYSYDRYYDPGAATITSNFAILATTNTGRGGIKGIVNLNNGGQNGDVLISALSGQHRTTTSDGGYWIKSLPPETTSVTAIIDGYFPGRVDSVIVTGDRTIDSINFNLTACPVPQHLIASDGLASNIEVTWDAITHADLAGYDLYRSLWQNGGFEKLNTTPIAVAHFTDSTATDSTLYWYYATAVYTNAAWGSVESFTSTKDSGFRHMVTGINGDNPLPKEFFLSQNYPNPFNPTTTISFGLPHDANVKIDIFNIMGQKISTLFDGRERAGYKQIIWDGKDRNGKTVSSGVYFYRVDMGDKQLTKKMTLLK